MQSPHCRLIRQVVRNVVHETPIDTDGSSRAGRITNFLQRVTDEALTISKYQSGRGSFVKTRKSWSCALESELLSKLRVTYGLTLPETLLQSAKS